MIDDPASDDEFVFASDFYARKFDRRRTGLCTELLRAGRTLLVDDNWRGSPEAGIAGVLRRQGLEVFYAENTLWRCLFGLLFWDELFRSGQLHSGFDWMPHCLKDRTFARLFAPEIDMKLEAVASKSVLPGSCGSSRRNGENRTVCSPGTISIWMRFALSLLARVLPASP